MSADDQSETIDINEVFPDLKPVRSAPTLFTWYGIGTALYGRRGTHHASGTWVKTLYVVVLFFPLFALGSYRVAHAAGGQLACIGKEPLAAASKIWNVLVLVLLLAGGSAIALHQHRSSPAYQRQQLLDRVAQGLSTEDLDSAAAAVLELQSSGLASDRLLQEQAGLVIAGLTGLSGDAAFIESFASLRQLRRLLDAEPRAALQQATVARLLAVPAELAPDAFRLLRDELPPAPDGSDPHATARLELLEQAVAAAPTAPDLVVARAEQLEAEGDTAACRTLLLPIRDQLGEGEGARILGQILAADGDLQGAYELLWPYTEVRLAELRRCQEQLDEQFELAYQRALDGLRAGKAPATWYRDYDLAGETQQQQMVDAWIGERLQGDARLAQLRADYEQTSAIVGVAFDLGIISLHHAQTLDGAERQAALERAEQAFLAIGGNVGESTDYQLSLAQVYAWMGRRDEATAIFDGLLAEGGEDPALTMQVAAILRELGDRQQARDLLEAAYEQAEDELRDQIASQRALLFVDLDDQVAWLRRDQSGRAATRANLAYALGEVALRDGDEAEAERQLRQAVDAYAALPETSSTLNNGALAARDLFRVTGSVADLQRANQMQRQALRQHPNHTILIHNTAHALLGEAVLAVVGDRLDYAGLGQLPGLGDLGFCAADHAEWRQLVDRLQQEAAFVESVELYRRLLVLAPRSADGWATLAGIAETCRDVASLTDLGSRIGSADLDLVEAEDGARASWAQEDRVERIDGLQTTAKRLAARLPRLSGLSRSYALCQQAGVALGLQELGIDQDLETHYAALLPEVDSSLGCRESLIGVRWAQLRRQLADQDLIPPRLAGLTGLVEEAYLVALTVDQVPAARSLLQEPIACDLLDRLAERRAADPWRATRAEWLLCRQVDAERGAICCQALLEHPAREARQQIAARVERWSCERVLQEAIDQLAAGNPTGSQTLLDTAVAEGMPLAGLLP